MTEKSKNLIWKVEAVPFLVWCCWFLARSLQRPTHGGLIQHQDSVQFLNKGWYYIKDGKKTGDHPACGNSGKNRRKADPVQ